MKAPGKPGVWNANEEWIAPESVKNVVLFNWFLPLDLLGGLGRISENKRAHDSHPLSPPQTTKEANYVPHFNFAFRVNEF
jgi:hypothetical protein